MEFTDEEILKVVGQLRHGGMSVMDGVHIIPTNWFDMDKQQLEVFSVKMMEPLCVILVAEVRFSASRISEMRCLCGMRWLHLGISQDFMKDQGRYTLFHVPVGT